MGIKVDIGELEAQATSIKSMVTNLNSNLTQIQSSLTNIANDNDFKGASAEAIKNFIGISIVPVFVSSVTSMEKLAVSAKKLVDEYKSKVDTKSWSEDELQEKINNLNNQITKTNEALNKLKKDKKKSKSAISKTHSLIDKLEDQKHHYQEILDHLREYNSVSESLIDIEFSESLKGISQISSAYTGVTGKNSFNNIDLDWSMDILDKATNIGSGYTGAVKSCLDSSKHIASMSAIGIFEYADEHMTYLENKLKSKKTYWKNLKESLHGGNIVEKAKNFYKAHKIHKAPDSLPKQIMKSNKVMKANSSARGYIEKAGKWSKGFGKISGFLNKINIGTDIAKRLAKHQSIFKIAVVVGGSVVAGKVAGIVTEGVCSLLPFAGPVFGICLGSYVDGKVSEKMEEFLDKEVKD